MKISSLWETLQRPSPEITDPIEREQAELFLKLLTLVLPLGLVIVAVATLGMGHNPLSPDHDSRYAIFSSVGWLGVYLLARTRVYRYAVWLAILIGIGVILLSAAPDNDYEDYFYLAYVLIFSSMFMNFKEICLVYLLSMLGIVLGTFLFSANFWDGVFYPASIVTIGGFLSVLSSNHIRKVHGIHAANELSRERRFRHLLETSFDGLAEISNSVIVDVDEKFLSLFKLPRESLVGRKLSELITISGDGDLDQQVLNAMAKTSDGTPLHLEVHFNASVRTDTERQLIAFKNITSRKSAEEELRRQAHHDPVTGLLNRTQLLKHITARKLTVRPNMRTSVLFLDLDNFKNVNDAFGHDIGDELLKEVSLRLMRVTRDEDVAVRYGGDEFVLVCDYPTDETFTIASRILSAFTQAFNLRFNSVRLTPSIGIVHDIADYEDVDSILRAADEAMYRAKARGKNQFEFAAPVVTKARADSAAG